MDRITESLSSAVENEAEYGNPVAELPTAEKINKKFQQSVTNLAKLQSKM